MNFEQLTNEIFENFEHKHVEILCDSNLTSQQMAQKILAKYNLGKLSNEQVQLLRQQIVQREVDGYLQFVQDNKQILDANLSFKQKLQALMTKYANDSLSPKQLDLLKNRLIGHIYNNETTKILQKLMDGSKF